jgi:hypothetical protein
MNLQVVPAGASLPLAALGRGKSFILLGALNSKPFYLILPAEMDSATPGKTAGQSV